MRVLILDNEFPPLGGGTGGSLIFPTVGGDVVSFVVELTLDIRVLGASVFLSHFTHGSALGKGFFCWLKIGL